MKDLQARAELLAAQTFLGVPIRDFAASGREHLELLVAAGLRPESALVDVGCGVLRVGYWLIDFLNADGYCGIEPHEGRLKMGIETILEPATIARKRPHFDTNDAFDTSVFGRQFDYFLAFSIWTHASKMQIALMLDSFARDAKQDGLFLTSYLPTTEVDRDYSGEDWYGTSHKSDVAGCIHHDLAWIETACAPRDLDVRELGMGKLHTQMWLAVTRRASTPALEPKLQAAAAHLARRSGGA